MITPTDLARLQPLVADAGVDGWLLFDFRGRNPIAAAVLGPEIVGSRRVYVLVPPTGPPIALVHAVDAELWRWWPRRVAQASLGDARAARGRARAASCEASGSPSTGRPTAPSRISTASRRRGRAAAEPRRHAGAVRRAGDPILLGVDGGRRRVAPSRGRGDRVDRARRARACRQSVAHRPADQRASSSPSGSASGSTAPVSSPKAGRA